jgi:hypothetical protein
MTWQGYHGKVWETTAGTARQGTAVQGTADEARHGTDKTKQASSGLSRSNGGSSPKAAVAGEGKSSLKRRGAARMGAAQPDRQEPVQKEAVLYLEKGPGRKPGALVFCLPVEPRDMRLGKHGKFRPP